MYKCVYISNLSIIQTEIETVIVYQCKVEDYSIGESRLGKYLQTIQDFSVLPAM